MRYSFTQAQPKYLLEPGTKIWLMFLLAALVILIAYSALIHSRSSYMAEQKDYYTQKREEVLGQITEVEKQIETILEEKQFAEEQVYAPNALLKDSIQNLFDMVPDQVTLTEVKMDKDTLIINGVTPSKEVYNFLMAVPLKSIFSQSEVKFYLMPNSWYNFESVNTIQKPQEVQAP